MKAVLSIEQLGELAEVAMGHVAATGVFLDEDDYRDHVEETKRRFLRFVSDSKAVDASEGAVESPGAVNFEELYDELLETFEAQATRLEVSEVAYEALRETVQRLERERDEAREAIGPVWFGEGATLAESIKMKTKALEQTADAAEDEEASDV